MKFLVFTDLDGTLLDHHTYSFEDALPAIKKLRELEIPVILNSSKTKPEMRQFRQAMENQHPFICENGGALYYPGDYFAGQAAVDGSLISDIFGQAHGEIITTLVELRKNGGYNFSSFHDMGVEGVSANTGLSSEKARMAMQRDCSEPILWLDTQEQLTHFKNALTKRGLRLVKGGRFYHVMGQFDKSDAMILLRKKYQEFHGEPFKTIALGDAPNDLAMLTEADYPVIIAHPDGYKVEIPEHQQVYYSKAAGPAGWNEALMMLLNQFNLTG